MARKLIVYFSLLSPWAYIGQGVLQGLVRKHRLDVDYRPVALMNVFPETGGLPLPRRHPSRQRYRMLELQRWREKRALNFHLQPRHWPFDPAPGDRLICALQSGGADPEPFIAAAFRATFEDQRDVAARETLAALLAETGYGPEWLARGESGEAQAHYERNLSQALASGVFGSPAYLLDEEVFWGQDRLDLLDDALSSGRPPFSAERLT